MCFKPLKELGKKGMVPPLHLCLAPIWRIWINNVNVDYIFLSFPIWNKSTIVWQIELCKIIVYNFLHFKYFIFNRKGIPTVTNRPSHSCEAGWCFWEIKMCLRPDASGHRVTPPLLRLSKKNNNNSKILLFCILPFVIVSFFQNWLLKLFFWLFS